MAYNRSDRKVDRIAESASAMGERMRAQEVKAQEREERIFKCHAPQLPSSM